MSQGIRLVVAVLLGLGPVASARAQEASPEPPTVQGMLQEQVARCWKPPSVKGTPTEGGVARIRVALLPDGTIEDGPSIIDKPAGPLGLTFAESAARAVKQCAPYRLPPELYDNWRDIMLQFDTITF